MRRESPVDYLQEGKIKVTVPDQASEVTIVIRGKQTSSGGGCKEKLEVSTFS